MPMNASTTVVLRRPSKSILTTKVSIPRISIDACDKCGHRLSKGSGNNEAQKYHSRRPHSLHVDQDNYLHLQQINQVNIIIEIISNATKFLVIISIMALFFRLNLPILTSIGQKKKTKSN